MRFETSQFLKLGQTMKLAPRMIQSMEILQMPLAELQERIEQELESNPTLELADGSIEMQLEVDGLSEGREDPNAIDPNEGMFTVADDSNNVDDFARLEQYEQYNPDAAANEFDDEHATRNDYEPVYRAESYEAEYQPTYTGDGDRDAKMEAMASAPAPSRSLIEQLREQWALVDVEDQLRKPGELIISFLDDADGYLRTPLETIADRAAVALSQEVATVTRDSESTAGPTFNQRPEVQLLERALKAIQLFLEPAGVAARDARECLLLQLDAMEENAADIGWSIKTFEDAKVIVSNHLDDLMQNRLPRVASETGLSLDEIKDALTLLKRLSLAPARRLVQESSRPITPDAIVEYDADQDRYFAYLNDRRLPNVRINMEYAKLTKDRTMAKKDREFIKTNLGNAQWLLDAVNQRKGTLLRVIEAIIGRQREFFDYGPQALKPLPMQTVADDVGIHIATVSRAVADKYIATPRGIVALRKFFSGGVQTRTTEESTGGENMAWDAVKAHLRDLIDHENKKKPLSDEALASALKAKGIDIARRTVAKYREQMSIQPARLRKVF